jgi:hypothetical protein
MQIATKKPIATEGSATTAPQLVRNGVLNDHLRALDDIVGRASNITIAVAFLKSKGLGKIVERLTLHPRAGALVEMLVETDFCHTEPEAPEELLNLSRLNSNLMLWIANPKTYVGVEGKTARVMIGSAYLTAGALGGNEEISLVWEVGPGLAPGIQRGSDPSGLRHVAAMHGPTGHQRGAHRLAPHDLPDWRECAKVCRRTTLPRFDFDQAGWICDPAR